MAVTRVLAGRYRLEQRLGGGGMSVVWRAYDEVLGRRVAVKMVSGRHANEALARERIRTEAAATARLNHPHLTKLLDHSDSGSTPYLVMELLEGQTLARRMRAGPLPVAAALEICAQVADALAAAHASGVVHRDIKPGNVMLTPDGATILDFGIAAFVDELDEPGGPGEPGGPDEPGRPDEPGGAARPARPGAARPPEPVAEDQIWGTAAYVAPERLTQRRVVPASDVYALGVLLYRMLTGRRPWTAVGRAEMLAAHVSVAPAPLPPGTAVPPDVAALCDRSLAKEPRARPTAREMAIVLAAATVEVSAPAPASAAAAATSAPAGAGMAGAAVGGAGMAGAVAAGAGSAGAVVPGSGAARRRFQRRHAATISGERIRRNALKVGSATLVAAMVATVSFCAVSDPSMQPVEPEAAPPPILPDISPPPDRGPGTGPPAIGPKPPGPSRPPGDAPAMRDTSGQAGGQRAPSGVPVDSRPGTGGRTSPRPSPKPTRSPTTSPTRPTPKPPPPPPPSPTPKPPSPSSPPPEEEVDPITEVVRTLETLAGTLTARCVGSTASIISWDPLLGFLVGEVDRGPAREVGIVFHALLLDVAVTVRCSDSGVPVLR